MAKDLKSILAGKKSSKTAPPNIDDSNFYQWNAKDGVNFIKKHKIETHDYPHDAEAAFKGKKGGMNKTSKYKFQNPGVYEESEESDPASLDEDWKPEVGSVHHFGDEGDVVKVRVTGHHDNAISVQHVNNPKKKDYVSKRDWVGNSSPIKEENEAASSGKKMNEIAMCNHTTEGTYCPMHEKKACPSEDDVNMQKKPKKDKLGREYLTDKKKCMDEDIHEVAPPNPKIEKWIKSNKNRFVKEYGKEKGMQVLYAKAWKMHGQTESGSATNTDYTGPGAAGWTTGRHDMGTL